MGVSRRAKGGKEVDRYREDENGEESRRTHVFACGPVALGHDDNLVPRDTVLLQRLSNDFLRRAVGVHVGGVPGINPHIVRRLEKGDALVFRC